MSNSPNSPQDEMRQAVRGLRGAFVSVAVFIRTGERTTMNYLLKPLLDRLNRAFNET